MKREINQIVILALAAAFFLGISSARAADETPVGKVQRIYVEANRGVLIEQTLGNAPAPLTKIHRATMLAAKWFTPQADAFDGSPVAFVSRLRAASPIF